MRQLEAIQNDRMVAAEAIVDGLPEPDYPVNYQLPYPEREPLVGAVAELLSMKGVTTPREVNAFSARMAAIGEGAEDAYLLISGSCRERIYPVNFPIRRLAAATRASLNIAAGAGMPNIVTAQRDRGQYTKPRSKGVQVLPSKLVVPAHVGDLVHGEDVGDRTPQPERMVAGAVQARALEEELMLQLGHHVPATHEALLLPYEEAFIRLDPETGDEYLLSADMPWAGVRTNQLGGAILQLLGRLKNTVGVKIDANSDEAHIAGLNEVLNPDQRPGKVVHMLRLGLHEADSYLPILAAIKKHAPNAVTIMDFHGITTTRPDGTKIRDISSMLQGMQLMARACQETGVRFDGLHIETTPDSSRLECIDEENPDPLDLGEIDPRANPAQTTRLIGGLALL